MTFPVKKLLLLLLCAVLLLSGCGSAEAPAEAAATETAAALTEAPAAEVLVEAVPQETEPEIYVPMAPIAADGIFYPGEFGEFVLGTEGIKPLLNSATSYAAEHITHVGDALLYMAAKPARDPKAAVQLFTALLEGDYPYVGSIEIAWDDNAYMVATVGLDGRYYALDPFHPDMDWVYLPENGCMGVPDLETLSRNVIDSWLWPGTNLVHVKIATDPFTQLSISYPEFQGAVLGKDVVTKLYRDGNDYAAAQAITTVADAYYYIQCGGLQFRPKETCELFVKLLYGDFDYVGSIELRFQNEMTYFVPYIQQDGIYYAFDPFAPFSRDNNRVDSNWVIEEQNNCLSSGDLDVLCEALVKAFPYTDAELDRLSRTLDMPSYLVAQYPELCGTVLGREKVTALHAAGDLDAAGEAISSISDALSFVELEELNQPKECCDLLVRLLWGDYDFTGTIDLSTANNHYFVFFLQTDGEYYAFDPFSRGSDWILNPSYDCFTGDDLEQLGQQLSLACPFLGKNEISASYLAGYELRPHGAETYSFADTTIPVGLGQPEYTCEEIDAFIALEDYAYWAEVINTFPDAVHLYQHLGLTFHDNQNTLTIGEFSYYCSAWQVLKDRSGQCLTMSNLNHYLLHDNYDEVGYVHVRSPGDGHIMTYILEDGMYYLINSVDYTEPRYIPWFDSYPRTVIAAAEDFQTIADSLAEHMLLVDKKPLNIIHLVNTPGDFLMGNRGGKELYPEGSIVTEYMGFGYTTAPATVRDWQSQTRIDE